MPDSGPDSGLYQFWGSILKETSVTVRCQFCKVNCLSKHSSLSLYTDTFSLISTPLPLIRSVLWWHSLRHSVGTPPSTTWLKLPVQSSRIPPRSARCWLIWTELTLLMSRYNHLRSMVWVEWSIGSIWFQSWEHCCCGIASLTKSALYWVITYFFATGAGFLGLWVWWIHCNAVGTGF